MTGAVLSILMVSDEAVVLSPASLTQLPLKVVPGVSRVCSWLPVQLTGPLTRSSPEVPTVTALVYQPLSPGVPEITDMAADGPLLSTFTVIGEASVLRPAPLVHDPPKLAPVVSSVCSWLPVQLTGPLTRSSPEVPTVTALVYQPLSLGVPEITDMTADGPLLSTFTVIGEASVLRPAPLVHDPPKLAPVVSSVCSWLPVQLTGPLTRSSPEVPTVTLLVYQPLSPGVPEITDMAAD